MKYFLVVMLAFGWLCLEAPADAETLGELPSCYDGLGDIWGEKEARTRMRKLDGAAIKSISDFMRATGTRDVSLKMIEGGDFSGWDFRNTPLHQVCFMGSDLKGANFAGAEGSGAGFIKSDLSGANMQGAVMPQVLFRNANLTDVDAKGANFSGGHFDGGWFEGAVAGWNIDGASMIEFQFDCGITVPDGCPVYSGGNPISARGANFTRAKLHSYGLFSMNTDGAILDNSIIGPAQLSYLSKADFQGDIVLRGGGEDVTISPDESRFLLEAYSDREVIDSNPSFDCSYAESKVEEEICTSNSKEMRRLDREVAALYDQVKKTGANVLSSQRKWLKGRNKCNVEEYADPCIRDSYFQRKGELLGMLGEQDWLAKGEEALFVDEVLALTKGFSETSLYQKIKPALAGASSTEILVKRGEDGFYSIRGSTVGANAHMCSLSATTLYLDNESGWYIPVTEEQAMPVFRYWDGRLEIFESGRPSDEDFPDSGNYMSCGARASFSETIRMDIDAKALSEIMTGLEN